MNKSSGKSRHALKYLFSGLLSGYHDVNTRVIIISFYFQKNNEMSFQEDGFSKFEMKKKISNR